MPPELLRVLKKTAPEGVASCAVFVSGRLFMIPKLVSGSSGWLIVVLCGRHEPLMVGVEFACFHKFVPNKSVVTFIGT